MTTAHCAGPGRARSGGRVAAALAGLLLACSGAMAESRAPQTMAEVLAASAPSDWRPLDPESTLYLQLASGRVVIEFATAFAPEHAANIKALARQRYYDGLAIVRSQDNFVVQWGDPDGKRSLGTARATLPPEFTTRLRAELPFTRLPDADAMRPKWASPTGSRLPGIHAPDRCGWRTATQCSAPAAATNPRAAMAPNCTS